jgi:uncharacterized protein
VTVTETQTVPTLARLQARRDDILRIAASFGARNVHVFGSVARGGAVSGSDVDLLVDVSSDKRGFAYFGALDDLRLALSKTLGCRVDVVDRAALSRLKTRVLREAVPL